MRGLIIIISLFIVQVLVAQDHPTCDGDRYRIHVFTDAEITEDIEYSEGQTIAGNTSTLYLDVYEPKGDVVESRPVIFLGFGGSFINGTRRDVGWLCEDYAKRGFVAVAIDYRLYDLPLIPFPQASDMQTVVVKSLVDMNAAIQFMLDDAAAANVYGVDTNMIFVGGISSGGIMACHTAMLDSTDNIPAYLQSKLEQEGVSGNGATLLGSKDIKGVINFSGALHIGDWYDAGDPPVFSYHDDGDATVPYKKGWAQVFGQDIVELEGSFILDSMATQRGMHSELHTINSPLHVSYFTLPAQRATVLQESAVFLYKLMCSDRTDVNEIEAEKPYRIGPNPSSDIITISLKEAGQMILYNVLGAPVWEAANSRTSVLDMHSLPGGSYILKIRLNGKEYHERVSSE